MPTQLLASTTTASASDMVQTPGVYEAVRFTCPGLAGAETGTLQSRDSSGSWNNEYENGNLVQVTATNTSVVVYGPGTYRINKSVTTAAVPVEVSTVRSP